MMAIYHNQINNKQTINHIISEDIIKKHSKKLEIITNSTFKILNCIRDISIEKNERIEKLTHKYTKERTDLANSVRDEISKKLDPSILALKKISALSKKQDQTEIQKYENELNNIIKGKLEAKDTELKKLSNIFANEALRIEEEYEEISEDLQKKYLDRMMTIWSKEEIQKDFPTFDSFISTVENLSSAKLKNHLHYLEEVMKLIADCNEIASSKSYC
jgi:hypothetical protein